MMTAKTLVTGVLGLNLASPPRGPQPAACFMVFLSVDVLPPLRIQALARVYWLYRLGDKLNEA